MSSSSKNKSNYEIEFLQELTNDVVLFKIIDRNNNFAGHAILAYRKKVSIIENSFFDFSDDDISYLKSRLELFYEAIH